MSRSKTVTVKKNINRRYQDKEKQVEIAKSTTI